MGIYFEILAIRENNFNKKVTNTNFLLHKRLSKSKKGIESFNSIP
ncbi:hypothetical protein PLO_1440 [Pediococcus acidilactici NGRI 0510Q]|nr:hypothetical protein PLO_1440 [Pediococcus acidilactici NGRI 0510Q]